MPVIKSSHRKCTDNILYELLVYSEWKQEPDVTVGCTTLKFHIIINYTHIDTLKLEHG